MTSGISNIKKLTDDILVQLEPTYQSKYLKAIKESCDFDYCNVYHLDAP